MASCGQIFEHASQPTTQLYGLTTMALKESSSNARTSFLQKLMQSWSPMQRSGSMVGNHGIFSRGSDGFAMCFSLVMSFVFAAGLRLCLHPRPLCLLPA